MKILAIGDPHGNLERIKKIPLKNIDLILLTGDLGSANLMRQMVFRNIERQNLGLAKLEYSSQQEKRAFMEAYNSTIKLIGYLARFCPVYTIYGNVESSNADTKKFSKKIKLDLPYLTDKLRSMEGVRVINNRIVNVGGVRIGGLEYFTDVSWVREFKPQEYSKRFAEAGDESERAREALRRFGSVDILMCHQPPYGVLDRVGFKGAPKDWMGKHAGSKVILDYIHKKKPRYVFCGHIHEQAGTRKLGNTQIYNLGCGGYVMIDMD